jgi:hypothetical protein
MEEAERPDVQRAAGEIDPAPRARGGHEGSFKCG